MVEKTKKKLEKTIFFGVFYSFMTNFYIILFDNKRYMVITNIEKNLKNFLFEKSV